MSDTPVEIQPFEGSVTVSLQSVHQVRPSAPATELVFDKPRHLYDDLVVLVSPRDITLAETNRSFAWGP